MRACDNEVTTVAHYEGPNLPMMSLQLLDALELRGAKSKRMAAGYRNRAYLVAVPIFQHTVLSYRPEVVAILLKGHLHDALVMREYRFMTIAEIQAPYLDIFVGGTSHNQF